MTTHLASLLKDSAYRLDQFKPEHIAALEAAVTVKTSGKTATPYLACLVRGKPVKLTPEEAVRQLYLRLLHDELGYPVSRMQLEYPVNFGRETKRADIPSIAPAVQAQVQSAVRQAEQARQHVARLLDAAKRAVEIAIEDSEAAALAHLEGVA